jgi:hypothetical protein
MRGARVTQNHIRLVKPLTVAELNRIEERPTLRSVMVPPPPPEYRRVLRFVNLAHRLHLHRTWVYRYLCRRAAKHLGLTLEADA